MDSETRKVTRAWPWYRALEPRGVVRNRGSYLAFVFAAQYFFILRACSLRCAALKVRFLRAGAGVAAGLGGAETEADAFFGGRPRALRWPL